MSAALLLTGVPARADDARDAQVLAGLIATKGKLDTLVQAGRYREAEALAKDMLAQAEKAFPHRAEFVLPFMNNLALVYNYQGRWKEADALQADVVARDEKIYGADHVLTAISRRNLASLRLSQGRFTEAEADMKRVLASHERQPMFDDASLFVLWNELASVYFAQGRNADSEAAHRKALAHIEKAPGDHEADRALGLNNLGQDLEVQRKYAEAETLYRRAADLFRRRSGPEAPNTVTAQGNLARVISFQGRNAEAEGLYKQALASLEKSLGATHPEVAAQLKNLAMFYLGQNRASEAEPLFVRIVAIYEKASGPEHPSLAEPLTLLATIRLVNGRIDEAEALLRRSTAIKEKVWGRDHPQLILDHMSTGALYLKQSISAGPASGMIQAAVGISAPATPADPAKTSGPDMSKALIVAQAFLRSKAEFQRALEIAEKSLGPEHPQTLSLVGLLAMHEYFLGRPDEAIKLIDRTIAIKEKGGDVQGAHLDYQTRAQARWAKGLRAEALADMRIALKLADELRSQGVGSDFDRAAFASMFASAFDQMVAFQAQAGNVAEAFDAAERGLTRTLLQQIERHGTDLLAGVPAAQASDLRRRRDEARAEVASLTVQLTTLEQAPGKPSPERKTATSALRTRLERAQTKLIDADREIHNVSPAVRLNAGPNRQVVPLDRLRKALGRSDALLLEYVVTEIGTYVIVVPGLDDVPARVETLTIDAASATTLGRTAGTLLEPTLQAILLGAEPEGILQRLARPGDSDDTIARTAALWQMLVPERERKDLLAGRYKRLVIVPDGPLAAVPFEALSVEAGEDPRLLLDAGPPILYVPSATLYQNLEERPVASFKNAARQPVLSLADPDYASSQAAAPKAAVSGLTRFRTAGGRLERLPSANAESAWVADIYRRNGIAAGRLVGETATEAGLRYWAPGRRVVHLACHGLVDQRFGNYFGALALSPGPKAATDPADDGLLNLSEISELNLKGCELVVLSACETNLGPRQQGDGTWALSRGFLVAGSRRVVASNWLVDDEAAASLVYYFCAGLAQAEKAGKPVDHAAALQAAKRLVRQQDRWKSPYYWASLVLIGPP